MAIATSLLLAGAGLGIIGSINSANAQSASLLTQANLFEMNSITSLQNAELARNQAKINSDLLRRESNIALGDFVSEVRSKGFEISGTPLEGFREAVEQNALAAERAIIQGEIQSTGFINQSRVSDFRARESRRQASTVRRSGIFGALGKGISTAGLLIK